MKSSLLTALDLTDATDPVVSVEKYNPAEARDSYGKWTSGGGSKESRASASAYAASERANRTHTAEAHFEAFISHNKAAQTHLSAAAKQKNSPTNAAVHLKLADTHLATATSHEKAGLSALKPKIDWSHVLSQTVGHVANVTAAVGGVVGAITAVQGLRDAYARRARKAKTQNL